MKKILLAALLVPVIALAQTFPSPTFSSLTLQNPLTAANGGTGATSATGTGSAVLSTAPTIAGLTVTGSLTATGLVTPADLAAQAANTILANGAGSATSPTAISVPSCSTSSSALQWTSGSGVACNTSINAATLGGTTFAAPGPVGSTTASTGAFTALTASGSFTATGLVTPADHATQAAGTVLANATASTASPTAVPAGNGISISSGVISSPSPIVYTMVSGDNTTGLQAAINAAEAAQVDLKILGNGTVSGDLIINSALNMYGAGRDNTFITCSTTTICIAVTTALAVKIHDFLIASSTTSGTTTQSLIYLSPGATLNQYSRIYDMAIGAGGIGVNTGGASGTDISNNIFSGTGATNPTFIVASANNTPNCNGGEFRVHDNYFIGATGQGQTGVLATCVGGLYVQNNKFVEVDHPVIFLFPEHDATGLAAQSGDLFIQGNSMELFAGTAINIGWAGGDSSDSFGDILIQHNEIKYPTSQSNGGVIIIQTSATPWLFNVQINNNDLGGFSSGTNILVVALSGVALDISHNLMSSSFAGTFALDIGSSVSGCTLGPNLTIGPSLTPNTGFAASPVSTTCSPNIAPY